MMAVRKTSEGEKSLMKMRCAFKSFFYVGTQVDFFYQTQRVQFIQRLHELVMSRSVHENAYLISVQKDLICDIITQAQVLRAIATSITIAHGTRWVEMGTVLPLSMRISNHALEDALRARQRTFSLEEWDKFGIIYLPQNGNIRVDNIFLQPDILSIDARSMGPAKMLHEIVLSIMQQNAACIEIQDECCAVLICLHQSPYRETYPVHDPTCEHHGMQTLRCLVVVIKQWRDNKDLQIFACMACVEACSDMGPGTTE